jgi:hypothetical protein
MSDVIVSHPGIELDLSYDQTVPSNGYSGSVVGRLSMHGHCHKIDFASLKALNGSTTAASWG